MIVKEKTGDKVCSAADVARILTDILSAEDEIGREREHLWVLGLNAKNAIQYVELSTLGTLTNSLMHPREVFRVAIHKGVASIIIGHNHPSGDTSPSRDDVVVAERLKSAGDLLGIKVLDSIIINQTGGFLSLTEKGII